MKVLVINLCQMGDLVQSTPFFHDLRQRGAHVTLLARKDQSETARGLPCVDRIIPLDLSALKELLGGNEENRLERAYNLLKASTSPLLQETFDSLYNMTHTRVGALLTETVNALEKKGMCVPDGRNRWTSGRAVRYLQQVLSHRSLNNIHVVDIHRTLLEQPLRRDRMAFTVTEENERNANTLLKEERAGTNPLFIGIQAGANEQRKQWPSDAFANLSDMILNDRDAHILLFGVASEQALTQEILARSPQKITDLTGKTGIGTLAALLKRCRILISNDTGTSHLAAAVGTQVLSLHLGHVYFRETGPYGQGHVSVQARKDCCPCSNRTACSHLECHRLLSPHAVNHLVRYMLDGTEITRDGTLENLEVMISEYDEQNFLTHRSLLKRPAGMEDLLCHAYGLHWKNYLTGNENPGAFQQSRDIFKEVQVDEMEIFLKEMENLQDLITEAEKTSRALAETSHAHKQEIRRLAACFKHLHEQILRSGRDHPYLRPLTEFYEIEQQNIRANGLHEVMHSFSSILEESSNQLKHIKISTEDWMKTALLPR